MHVSWGRQMRAQMAEVQVALARPALLAASVPSVPRLLFSLSPVSSPVRPASWLLRLYTRQLLIWVRATTCSCSCPYRRLQACVPTNRLARPRERCVKCQRFDPCLT